MLYGHRRDVVGYAAALEAFDRRLPELEARLRPGDLVLATADHGCDPTWPGSDHTREHVPVLFYRAGRAGRLRSASGRASPTWARPSRGTWACRRWRTAGIASHDRRGASAREDGHLTPEMRAAFDADGYLFLENFVAAGGVRPAARAGAGAGRGVRSGGASHGVLDHQRARMPPPTISRAPATRSASSSRRAHSTRRGELKQPKALSINKLGHAMHDLDPAFDALLAHGEAARVWRGDLGFRAPRLLQSMYIFKQPHIGGEVSWHVDSTYLYTEPLSCIGFWFALEDATMENGAMWCLPGAHRMPLKSRFLRRDGKLVDGGAGFIAVAGRPAGRPGGGQGIADRAARPAAALQRAEYFRPIPARVYAARDRRRMPLSCRTIGWCAVPICPCARYD